MSVGEFVSEARHRFQGELLPFLAEEVGPLGKTHRRFVAVPDLAPVERHVRHHHRGVGHPPADRDALARASVARAVWDLPTTAAPVDRRGYDPTPRRLCGRSSRVRGPQRVDVLPGLRVVRRDPASRADARGACQGRLRGLARRAHIPRDSTAITGRERPVPKPGPERTPKRRRGRPRRGEEAVRQPTRLERQLKGGMSTAEMVGELPKARDVGTKRNAKGYRESWHGYKMHIDAADGDIPVSRVLTSASLHDSQAAIPLARMTAERVDHRYGLMDAVCDSREIGAHARMAGEALARRGAGQLRPEGLLRGTAQPGMRGRHPEAGHGRRNRDNCARGSEGYPMSKSQDGRRFSGGGWIRSP